MAGKKAGPTSKKVEIKTAVTIYGPTSKVVTLNGPTSKQAFRKVEEEQRARLTKQRKAEEWLQKIIEKEEGRIKPIQHAVTDQEKANTMQKINPKEEEQKTAQRAKANNKGVADAGRNLTKSSMEAGQRHIRVEQMKHVKAVHRTQMLDRITEETENASSGRQGIVDGQLKELSMVPKLHGLYMG